VRIGVRWGL
jgi:hypothetical protein